MDLNSSQHSASTVVWRAKRNEGLFSTHSLSSSLFSGCKIVFRIPVLRSCTYGSQEHTRGAISKG